MFDEIDMQIFGALILGSQGIGGEEATSILVKSRREFDRYRPKQMHVPAVDQVLFSPKKEMN